jgi:hypothetical protein
LGLYCSSLLLAKENYYRIRKAECSINVPQEIEVLKKLSVGNYIEMIGGGAGI